MKFADRPAQFKADIEGAIAAYRAGGTPAATLFVSELVVTRKLVTWVYVAFCGVLRQQLRERGLAS